MNTDKIYAEALVSEYAPKDTSKVVALKKLDRKAKLPADIFAYTFGIATTLLAGVGMCLAMEQIGAGIPGMKLVGILVGLVGFAGAGITYPIYKRIRTKRMEKYAFDILQLARDISEDPQ